MKLVHRLREAMRVRHLSFRTEESYVQWFKCYVTYHGMRHAGEMGAQEVGDFLTHLANQRQVSRATQNQALKALVFFYRHVLEKELEAISSLRAPERRRMPVVLTVEEVKRLLDGMEGVEARQCRLLYGCGLRLRECLGLREKDLGISDGMLTVRGGKGDKHRVVTIPKTSIEDMKRQLDHARMLHEKDRSEVAPGVALPGAFERKDPGAGTKWEWFWLFPAGNSRPIRAPGRCGAITCTR
jgi:site-specific recombinase XerD